jgi:formyl-CoA transferase
MGDKVLAADPDFATNIERVKRRAETDGRVAAAFGALDVDALVEKLAAADIAFGRVNGPAELVTHPHLRRIDVGSPNGPLSFPAPAAVWAGEQRQYGPIPAVGEHSEKIRTEFQAGRNDKG